MTVVEHTDVSSLCLPNRNISAPHSLLVFKATGVTIIVTASLLGNTLCLVVLRRMRHLMEPVTRVFMTSLTIADLSTGVLLGIPIIGATISDCWPYGQVFCTINSATDMVCMSCTTVSVFNLTIERFIAVMRPFDYRQICTLNRARLLVVVMWSAAILFASLTALIPGRTGHYSAPLHTCLLGPADPNEPDILGTVFIIFCIFVPLISVLMMMCKLFYVARGHARRIAEDCHRGSVSCIEGSTPQTRPSRIKPNNKAFVTVFMMTLCLSICTFPLGVAFIYENLTRQDLPLAYIYVAEMVAFTIGVWDLVIYYIRNAAFRETLKRLIGQILTPKCPCIDTNEVITLQNQTK